MNPKMRLTVSVIILLLSKSVQAQVVMFNDVNFKNILLSNTEINTNNDDEIQVSEAESFTGNLELTNVSITDLTGLEAFKSITELAFYSLVSIDLDVSENISLERLTCTNLSNLVLGNNEALNYVFTDLNNFTDLVIDNSYLDTLYCWHNNNPMTINLSAATSLKCLNLNDNALSSLKVSFLPVLETLICHVNFLPELDVSNNPLLEYLECQLNPLTSLDVSENLNLKYLSCSNTLLSSIDVSQNIALESLSCDFTPLTFLDVSNNENLTWLDCYGSSLNLLNVSNGNNMNFQHFDMRENLDMECIQVDDEAYSNSNWLNVPDPSVYSELCEGLTSSNNINKPLLQYKAYPNPTNHALNIELDRVYNSIEVEIYDILGKKIGFADFSFKSQIEIDLNKYLGLVFLNVKADEYEARLKVMKE